MTPEEQAQVDDLTHIIVRQREETLNACAQQHVQVGMLTRRVRALELQVRQKDGEIAHLRAGAERAAMVIDQVDSMINSSDEPELPLAEDTPTIQ